METDFQYQDDARHRGDHILPNDDQLLADSDENYEDDNFSHDSGRKKKKKKRFKMFCFSCNRPEYHSLKAKKGRIYSYLLGMTFGLLTFIGPFTCVCCGNYRFWCRNWLNPRFWFRNLGKKKSKRKSSSKR